MLGTWFDPENNNYSNEVHTRNADVVTKHDGPVYAEWELDYLTFTHYRDREWASEEYKIFDKVNKVKNRVKYDFDAAQKIVS